MNYRTMMHTAQKKKQKKVKQRQRTNETRTKRDTDVLENCNNITNNTDTDVLATDSAFVQSIVKQKANSKNSNVDIESRRVKESNNGIGSNVESNIDCTNIPDDLQGFTTVVRDKGINKLTHEKTPEEYRKKGYDLILRGEKLLAVHYLSKAIEFDATDIRHYINRSYCYLNTGEYSRVLDDVHRILAHIDDPIQLNKMKCREAQALWGMQNYDGATECFNDSLNFMPNCIPVKCECMRMKVVELTSLGFSERAVLELLHDAPGITIKDAVTFFSMIESDELGKIDRDNNIEDDIFQSDCDDYPSNTRLFMDIIGFDDENEDTSWREISGAGKIVNDAQWKIKKTQTSTNDLKIINAAASSKSLTKKPVHKIEGECVWVGNLTPKITETVLLKHFSKFGKVASVFKRSPRYAFVNFQEASSAQKAIEDGTIKIGDAVLVTRSGKNSK